MRTAGSRARIWIAPALAAMLLAAASAFLLLREIRRLRAGDELARLARVEALAADFQDALRDASAPPARRAACRVWMPGRTPVAAGRFEWTPPRRLVWQEALAAPLAERLRGFSHWNEWTTPGKKNARRGLLEIEERHVLWARVGDSVYGVAFAASPAPTSNFTAVCGAAAAVVLLLFALLAHGLWRAVAEYRRLRAENAAKTAFLSIATHELKMPLAAVKLWCELLLTGKAADEETRAKGLRTIAGQNAHMIQLVDNLLDSARLEGGRRVYRFAAVDVAALARDVVAAEAAAFAEHGLSCAADAPAWAWADASAVRQILLNLVGNAAKYAADRGTVEISAVSAGTRVVLAVADRGPGIPAAARARIFERFYRVDGSLTAEKGGLGLGLAISRALARGMDGDLAVAPRSGGGCTFTLTLRRAAEEGEK